MRILPQWRKRKTPICFTVSRLCVIGSRSIVGRQAFAVIREAIRQEGMVALGKVVFTSREHSFALEARGKGMMGVTLRYPYEVRDEEEYFADVADEAVPKD